MNDDKDNPIELDELEPTVLAEIIELTWHEPHERVERFILISTTKNTETQFDVLLCHEPGVWSGPFLSENVKCLTRGDTLRPLPGPQQPPEQKHICWMRVPRSLLATAQAFIFARETLNAQFSIIDDCLYESYPEAREQARDCQPLWGGETEPSEPEVHSPDEKYDEPCINDPPDAHNYSHALRPRHHPTPREEMSAQIEADARTRDFEKECTEEAHTRWCSTSDKPDPNLHTQHIIDDPKLCSTTDELRRASEANKEPYFCPANWPSPDEQKEASQAEGDPSPETPQEGVWSANHDAMSAQIEADAKQRDFEKEFASEAKEKRGKHVGVALSKKPEATSNRQPRIRHGRRNLQPKSTETFRPRTRQHEEGDTPED